MKSLKNLKNWDQLINEMYDDTNMRDMYRSSGLEEMIDKFDLATLKPMPLEMKALQGHPIYKILKRFTFEYPQATQNIMMTVEGEEDVDGKIEAKMILSVVLKDYMNNLAIVCNHENPDNYDYIIMKCDLDGQRLEESEVHRNVSIDEIEQVLKSMVKEHNEVHSDYKLLKNPRLNEKKRK